MSSYFTIELISFIFAGIGVFIAILLNEEGSSKSQVSLFTLLAMVMFLAYRLVSVVVEHDSFDPSSFSGLGELRSGVLLMSVAFWFSAAYFFRREGGFGVHNN